MGTILPVVMAGGSGTRLWPLSRSAFPKQFLPLVDDSTMLQQTITRVTELDCSIPLTICNEVHRFMVAEQLRAIDKLGSIILEPQGRNTAPAIALAAEISRVDEQDPLLLVLAADHVIQDGDAFVKAVRRALPLAEQGKLVTFGVVPDCAHTGYGYIQRGDSVGDGFEVSQFVEKPDLSTAEQYLASEKYYWNSGMFLFKASRYLEELNIHRPDIAEACRNSLVNTRADLDFVRLDEESFLACADESIDYAVMEKTDDAVVIPLDAGWNDIGSWSALWEINSKDENNNAFRGDVISHDSSNCLVHSDERLVATVGLDDIVVVDTKDAVMVAKKSRVQEVKKIVEQIKSSGRREAKLHREVYRPWGKYDSVDNGNRYQVKRITVNPGAKLSVQMHHHRAEHWIVVSGTAKVTNGGQTILVTENESTYIPVGVVHALENPGKMPLEMIEVQVGSYLGEDDIVRFEDRYGRVDA
ncbi:mannose-1-phosphate guanylyltransferase [Ferrimonas sediminum]|uniref:mannose-1-phosphate guanylyltransferase n=1 Tax=Ferrimonas sediminum TaxID=718193 RepID=A0A1G8Z0R4_9GAMM|nr:mannose-1-phosphate guanylyltransferase/mannose-6-phosphate isomerase [Ferrimonas sediminum]SDK08636.1 mannose-1-phosphate guanylyltransferase [Ferrimonas sediminum]